MPGKEGVEVGQGKNGLALQAKKHYLLRLCGKKKKILCIWEFKRKCDYTIQRVGKRGIGWNLRRRQGPDLVGPFWI